MRGNLGSAVGALTLGGTQAGGGATNGTLLMTTGISWAGSITTAGAGGTLLVATGQTSTLSGTVADAAGLTVGNASDTGTLTLSGVISGSGRGDRGRRHAHAVGEQHVHGRHDGDGRDAAGERGQQPGRRPGR